MRVTLCLIALSSVFLVSCTSLGIPPEQELDMMISEFQIISDEGLECLVNSSISEPVVNYDIVRTESLIEPIRGQISVVYKEVKASLPDGTPLLTQTNQYKFEYYYENRGWIPSGYEVIFGNDLDQFDPVFNCFQ
jgi:hypothetical protein